MSRSFFIAGGHPPKLLEPVHPALPPTAEPVHRLVETRWPPAPIPFGLALVPLIAALRDHMADPAPPQQPSALRVAVAFIQGDLLRPFAGPTSSARHPDAV
jgi:hypothetical protein